MNDNSSNTELTLYLAGRDVTCPFCGYNLRDCKAAHCPECGHYLQIINGQLDGQETVSNLPWMFGVAVVVPPMALAIVVLSSVLIEVGLTGCVVIVIGLAMSSYVGLRAVRSISRQPAVCSHITDRSSSAGRYMRFYLWFMFYGTIVGAPLLAVLLMVLSATQ